MATIVVGIDFDDTIAAHNEKTDGIADINGGPGAWGACFDWLKAHFRTHGHDLNIMIVTAKSTSRVILQETAEELSCPVYSVRADYAKIKRDKGLRELEAVAEAKLAYLQAQKERLGAAHAVLIDDSDINIKAMTDAGLVGILADNINDSCEKTYALFVTVLQQLSALVDLKYEASQGEALIKVVKAKVAENMALREPVMDVCAYAPSACAGFGGSGSGFSMATLRGTMISPTIATGSVPGGAGAMASFLSRSTVSSEGMGSGSDEPRFLLPLS